MNNSSNNHGFEGHRERLRNRFATNSGNLSEVDKLELLFSYTIPRKNVRPLSIKLINKHKTTEIRGCRRAGLYDLGCVFYEKGGLRLDTLKETERWRLMKTTRCASSAVPS